MNSKNLLNAVHFIVLYSISIVLYHAGCLGLPNWSEQNMIRRCLSLLFFERNDEDYRDNMKTVTHTSHHIRMLRDNEGTYENNTIREICSIYMYIFPASRCPCPIYIGWMFSFILILSISQVPLSTHIFLRKQVLIFNQVEVIQSPLFLKFINPCDDNQPHWSPTYLCSTYQASIMEALLLAFMKPMRPPMKIIAANLGSQESTGNHWS